MPIQPGRTFQRMYTNRESLRRSSLSYLCALSPNLNPEPGLG